MTDGGGLVKAEFCSVQGAEQIDRYLAGIADRADLTILERTVNGQPGLVVGRSW